MTTVEIILLVVAIAFVFLSIYLVRLICASCKTLSKINQTVDSLQKQLDDLGHEPRDLIHHVNEISADVQGKMKSIDPLFRAVSNVGEELELRTALLKEKSLYKYFRSKSASFSSLEDDTPVEFIEWALLGINLWQKFKRGR